MKKGFTLIELLVVIAIIGILASIIMVSLSGASDKAKDARIKGVVHQARPFANMIYDDDNSYGEFCTSSDINTSGTGYDTQLSMIKTDITDQGGTVYNCLDSSTAFCLSVLLNIGDYYCMDSEGLATTVSDMGSNCTSTDLNCS